VTAAAFLAFALEVEERVVDTDRHADQQHDVGDRAAVGEQVGQRGVEAEGRADR
jgi:hypothetical protein